VILAISITSSSNSCSLPLTVMLTEFGIHAFLGDVRPSAGRLAVVCGAIIAMLGLTGLACLARAVPQQVTT
jgi:uncharacterized membrane protein